MEPTDQHPGEAPYPVQFAVEYPDRDLDRLRTAFRLVIAIPIGVVLASVSGSEAAAQPVSTPRPSRSARAARCSSGRS